MEKNHWSFNLPIKTSAPKMSSDESDREQMDEDTKFDDLNEDKRTIEEIYQKMSPIEHSKV